MSCNPDDLYIDWAFECDCCDYYRDYDGYDAEDEYPRETEEFDCD